MWDISRSPTNILGGYLRSASKIPPDPERLTSSYKVLLVQHFPNELNSVGRGCKPAATYAGILHACFDSRPQQVNIVCDMCHA